MLLQSFQEILKITASNSALIGSLLTYDGAPGKMKYPPQSGAPQLFNPKDDAGEDVNLAMINPKLVSELSALLDEWYVPTEPQAGKSVLAAPKPDRKPRRQ